MRLNTEGACGYCSPSVFYDTCFVFGIKKLGWRVENAGCFYMDNTVQGGAFRASGTKGTWGPLSNRYVHSEREEEERENLEWVTVRQTRMRFCYYVLLFLTERLTWFDI